MNSSQKGTFPKGSLQQSQNTPPKYTPLWTSMGLHKATKKPQTLIGCGSNEL